MDALGQVIGIQAWGFIQHHRAVQLLTATYKLARTSFTCLIMTNCIRIAPVL